MSDSNETITILRIGLETQYFLLKGAVQGILHLIQLMKKMEINGMLKGGEMESFDVFIKATKGQFQLLNIPTEDADQIEKMKQDLEKLGVAFVNLPDLNPGDGITQIAYYIPHTEKMEAWYKNFCMNQLQGGEKDYTKLQNLTERNTSIVSIPWKGDLQELKEDLNRMRINYAVLPDLNVGDGYVQILYANADAPGMRTWYELFQKDMIKNGEKPEEMQELSMEEYMEMGKMSTKEYEQTANEEIGQVLHQSNKNRERTDFEKSLAANENRMVSVHEERYLRLKEQPGMEPITINESLIRAADVEQNLLLVRIPGTMDAENRREIDVVIPLNETFLTDDDKTYVAFLHREKEYQTFVYTWDAQIPFTEHAAMKGKELCTENHFEKVTRSLDMAIRRSVIEPKPVKNVADIKSILQKRNLPVR